MGTWPPPNRNMAPPPIGTWHCKSEHGATHQIGTWGHQHQIEAAPTASHHRTMMKSPSRVRGRQDAEATSVKREQSPEPSGFTARFAAGAPITEGRFAACAPEAHPRTRLRGSGADKNHQLVTYTFLPYKSLRVSFRGLCPGRLKRRFAWVRFLFSPYKPCRPITGGG